MSIQLSKTQKLAMLTYKNKIHSRLQVLTLNKPNITDFAKERNLLMKKSKSEWVLFLDSDEVASHELIAEIKKVISKVPNLAGYYIKRNIYFLGKNIGDDKVLRLGKRNSGKWERAVHEVWKINTRLGTLKEVIKHNTADNLFDYVNKMNKYSTLHAIENIKEGKKTSILKIIVYPTLKFFQNFIKGRGFVFSMMQSFHSFLSWTKQWELQKG